MAQKDKFEKQHDKELAQIQNKIGYVYEQFVKEVAAASGGLKNVPLDKPFRLKDYPLTEKRIEKLLEKLSSQISTFVVNGVRGQWTLANEKNNELCNVVFGDMIDKLTKEQRRLYYNNNDKALDAFLDRKEKGMNLSQRVWRYVGQSREQIESTLELGIKTGESADQMARNLKEYLVYPDKLFRRVRGADGELHLSKAAADFHPGAGVMRSSYKNALRLAATENNIAYRTADHIRHTQLSFIVGIEIHLSKNHTLNGRPFTDICDDLKGKYPKWFHFEGWHPWCRCYQTTILKTPEEVERDLDGADRGSVNAVEKVPDNYKTWVEEHREKIDAAETRGTLPYFLSHNRWTWDERAAQPMIKKDALTVAVERHALRTPEQVEEIKARWQERYYSNHYAEGILGIAEKIPDLADYDTLNGRVEKLRELYANGATDYGALRAAAQRVSEMLKDIRTDLAYLDNPLGVMTEWGIGKAGEVNGAVAQKLSSWQMQGYSNFWLKGKLEFEIKWLEENKKHSTWKVAQDAYKKALDELQTRMYWQASGVQSMIDAYPKKLQAISRYDIIAKIKAAYKRRDVDEMAEVLQEAKEAIEWHERETVEAEPYLKGKYHTMLSKLDAANNMHYIADIQNALKKKDINAFDKAIDSADAMVSIWQQFGKNLPPLLADAINYGGTREAGELNNAYEAYDFNKFVMLHPKVEAFVKIGARLAKTQDYTTPGTDNYNILVGTGNAKIISDMEHAVAARDVDTAELLIDNAINIVNTWHDIVTSANEMKANNVPRSLRDDIDRALATYNSAVWPDIKARYNEWDSHQKLIARVKELALFDTKSKEYAALLAEADGYVVTEDWVALQSAITKLEARKSQIEKDRAHNQKRNLGIDPNALKWKRGGNFQEYVNVVFDHDNKALQKSTGKERGAIWDYTESSGQFNRPLCGHDWAWGFSHFKGIGKVTPPDGWKLISKALSRCKTEVPMWLSHGGHDDQFEGIFGESLFTVSRFKYEREPIFRQRQPKDESEVQHLVGKRGVFEGFLSMSATECWSKDIKFNVYMPAGTEAMLIAPISHFDGCPDRTDAVNTKSMNRNACMDYEAETLLNQGYEFQILAIKRSTESGFVWEVDMIALTRSKSYWKKFL